MEKDLDKILLLTAFCCIACDGDIAKEEITLLKNLTETDKTFGDINVDDEINSLVARLQKQGPKFLEEYFDLLSSQELSDDEQIKLLQLASDAINADNVIEYSEVKFFKSIRLRLKVTDEKILENVTGIEDFWLEQDTTDLSLSAEEVYSNLQFKELVTEKGEVQ